MVEFCNDKTAQEKYVLQSPVMNEHFAKHWLLAIVASEIMVENLKNWW